MLLLFKLVITLTVFVGLKLTWVMHQSWEKVNLGGKDCSDNYIWHRNTVYQLFWVTFIAVPVVEVFKFFLPQLREHPKIFPVHLFFAFLFFGILSLMAYWLWRHGRPGGASQPKIHAKLVLPCAILGLITNVLGEFMALSQH